MSLGCRIHRRHNPAGFRVSRNSAQTVRLLGLDRPALTPTRSTGACGMTRAGSVTARPCRAVHAAVSRTLASCPRNFQLTGRTGP